MGEFFQGFYALILLLGGLIAIIGILIFVFKKRSGENNIEMFSFKFKTSDASLVIVIMGCMLMVFAGMKVGDAKNELTAAVNKETDKKGDTPAEPQTANPPNDYVVKTKTGQPAAEPEKETSATPQQVLPKQAENTYTNAYPNSVLSFCSQLDANGAGYDFANNFMMVNNPDFLYFAMDNQGKTFGTSKVTFYIYKKEGANNQLKYTLPIYINPAWTYFYQQIFFNEPGYYQVKAYDADNRYMVASNFNLQQ